MKILLLGHGGREHALAWKLTQEKSVSKLYCDGKSDAIGMLATTLEFFDETQLIEQVKKHNIDLVLIGGEQLLSDGLVDKLSNANIKAFGPSKQAAQLESSKIFTRKLCEKYNIPSVKCEYINSQDNLQSSLKKLDNFIPPYVIKADGLAAGKGVIITNDKEEAKTIIINNMKGGMGDAGRSMLIEEFIEGREISFFALCDGKNAIPLFTASDYKKAFDNDQGSNTGGMGAISPSPFINQQDINLFMADFIYPTLFAMHKENSPFRGILYAGLMKTQQGYKLIEYNVRFGDPECQTYMRLLDEDFAPFLLQCCLGKLPPRSPKLKSKKAVLVVLASKGYPATYQKNQPIDNLQVTKHVENDIVVFHAGTKLNQGHVFSNGGRVLNVTALAEGYGEAARKCYDKIKDIDWRGGFYRKDIARNITDL